MDPLRWSFFGGGRGGAAEVSVFESVAVAFEGDDVGVVDEAVDHRGGDDVVTEYFAPTAEGFVGRDDQARAFVAGGDELEEQVRRFGFERDVADFVDDEQRVAAEFGELVLQTGGVVGVEEPRDPLGGGREEDPVSGLAGAHREPCREVGFAGAWGSEEHHVLFASNERPERVRHSKPNQGRTMTSTPDTTFETEIDRRFPELGRAWQERGPGRIFPVHIEMFERVSTRWDLDIADVVVAVVRLYALTLHPHLVYSS